MSPSGAAEVETVSLSDVGRSRSENQDNFGEFSDAQGRRLLFVADGMGGHQGGQTASRVAVDVVGRVFESSLDSPKELLRNALRAASRQVFDAAAGDIHLRGMGTTGVALLLDGDNEAWAAHVGDSRLYRLRDGRLEILTEDHSLLQRLIREEGMSAEDAADHPGSHVLERAIGPDPDVEVDVSPVSVMPGDVFLLCSDGLWGEVPDEDIAQMLTGRDLGEIARSLIGEANRNGGGDNITVSLARIGGAAVADSAGASTEVAATESVAAADVAPVPVPAAPSASSVGALTGALWLTAILALLLVVALGALWWTTREPATSVATEAPAETAPAEPAPAGDLARDGQTP